MPVDLLVARIVHILATAVWVGGTIFLIAVAAPYARSLPDERRSEAMMAIGRRFRPVAWTALAALLCSGLYTMWKFGLLSWALLTTSEYGWGLRLKLVLVAAIVVLSALHDFVLGPRAQRSIASQRALVVLARCNGVLTIVVPIIGVLLAH